MRTKRATTTFLISLLAVGLLATMGGLLFIWMQHKAQQAEPAPEPIPMPTYVNEAMGRMSLHDKVASVFILHTPGTEPRSLTSYMQTYTPGGLIFMGDTIPAVGSALPTLTQAAITDEKLPPFTAIDEEGGVVTRLPEDTFAGAETLRNESPDATKQAFMQRSHLLKNNGFNLNFGIIADTSSDPASFIYPRVLGTTPEASAERVAAAVEGSAGITLSTLKHFPGHGETPDDSHATIPSVATSYNDWQNRVSLPFAAGIDAGADMLMFGHLRYTAVDDRPASLSKRWHDIARNELGFQGVIMTDDMLMLQHSGDPAYADPVANATEALKAGSELLLYVVDHGENTNIDINSLINGVTQAVESGEIEESRINEIVQKLLTIRYNLSA